MMRKKTILCKSINIQKSAGKKVGSSEPWLTIDHRLLANDLATSQWEAECIDRCVGWRLFWFLQQVSHCSRWESARKPNTRNKTKTKHDICHITCCYWPLLASVCNRSPICQLEKIHGKAISVFALMQHERFCRKYANASRFALIGFGLGTKHLNYLTWIGHGVGCLWLFPSLNIHLWESLQQKSRDISFEQT